MLIVHHLVVVVDIIDFHGKHLSRCAIFLQSDFHVVPVTAHFIGSHCPDSQVGSLLKQPRMQMKGMRHHKRRFLLTQNLRLHLTIINDCSGLRVSCFNLRHHLSFTPKRPGRSPGQTKHPGRQQKQSQFLGKTHFIVFFLHAASPPADFPFYSFLQILFLSFGSVPDYCSGASSGFSHQIASLASAPASYIRLLLWRQLLTPDILIPSIRYSFAMRNANSAGSMYTTEAA